MPYAARFAPIPWQALRLAANAQHGQATIMTPLDWIKLGFATLDAALTEHRATQAADALEVAKENERRARERLAKLRKVTP